MQHPEAIDVRRSKRSDVVVQPGLVPGSSCGPLVKIAVPFGKIVSRRGSLQIRDRYGAS
jgi:hypothetical protein